MRFYAEMQKKKEHLKLKPVAVKKAKPLTAISTAAPKTNLAQKRFNGLLNSD
jgi:DNA-directed RNA polymerase alpha subunit